MDADGAIIDLFPDLLDYIAQQEKWTIEYVYGTWTECLERLEQAELDVAFTEPRENLYAFNQETVFVNWGRCTRTTAWTFSSPDPDGPHCGSNAGQQTR